MPSVLRGMAHTLEAVTSECSEFSAAWCGAARSGDMPRLWEGEWRSETNSHHGSLRCVLKPISADKFEAFFRAKYSRFLRACYRVALDASRRDPRTAVQGSTDLGPLAGGVYEYEGTITPQEFVCRYKCRYDEGTFSLKPFRGG